MKFMVKHIVRLVLKKYWSINYQVKIKSKVIFNHKTLFQGKNVIGKNVNISNSFIGFGSYVGDNTSLMNCHIGKYCSIASNIRIVIGTHPTKDFVSTHPAFFSLKKQSDFTYVKTQKFSENKYSNGLKDWSVSIGNDVWIGDNVLIMEGATIRDGSIIAAGAIVTKDTEPYGIYGGVPAKLIKKRFTPKEIDTLLKIQWWEWSEEEIIKQSEYFENIDIFVNEVEGKEKN